MSKTCTFTGCERGTRTELCFWHRPKKRPKSRGKQSFLWELVRAEWIAKHGYDHLCYICGVRLDESTLTLDHVIPRSSAKNYANRHSESNLKPCCLPCNNEKGSKHG